MRRYLMTLILFAGVASAQPTPPDSAKWNAETVDILRGLIKLDTSNPPGNEIIAAKYIANILQKDGIASEIFEAAPGRATIVARLKGNGKKRPLLLMGHIDVVGVERNRWTVDPFAAVVKDGVLYGRGSVDDKAMVAANLVVFLQLKRQGVKLDRDVIYMAEAGEEGTSQFGIDFMVEKHWDKIDAEFALNEGGSSIMRKDGKLPYVGVQTTEKVPRGLNLIARGSSGHGSMPRLDNPVIHLAAAVAKIGAWQAPMRLNETTKAFFERLATISAPEEAAMYRNLADPAVQEKLRATNIQFNSMLRTSVVPTIIQGGFRENVIPADAKATLDVRALPDEDIDKLIETLKGLINDPSVTIERRTEGQKRPAATPSAIDTEMFRALERAQKKVYPDAITVPFMQTGATDAAQLRAKGMNAYGIGVAISQDELGRVHGNDEQVTIANLGKFVEYLHAAVIDIAGAK
ncbi:MAG TPA: M20/M25/M40 family metallo-hydrolase [Terriglobales bacterium]|nr:M20/M25/M40 family metallo-hydrolase [Terriglobales bacterium]